MHLQASSLERWFTQHPGPYRHSLASTQLAAPPWAAVEALLPADWREGLSLGYSEPGGDPELRGLVAADYGVPEGQVILTQGAVEANWLAMASLIAPGDRVVVQMPIYPQLPLVAEALGAEVLPWTGEGDLLELVDDRTRLVVLNSPHNPTGRVVPEADLRALAARLARTPRGYLLVDEVYRGVGEAPLPPSAFGMGERVLVSNSTSKAWALPGLRVGWLVGPAEVIERAVVWREHTGLALSSLSEGVLKALWPHRRALIEGNQQVLKRNRGRVVDWLSGQSHLAGTPAPTAGCFLLRPSSAFDDVAACEQWYQADRVLMIPGSTIGYPGTLRVGYGHREAAALMSALAYLSVKLHPASA